MTARINDADNSGSVSTGDTLRFTYSNCIEDGVKINGIVSVSELVVDSATVYRGQTTMDGFRVTDGSDVFGVDGTFRIDANETPGVPAVYNVDGTSLKTFFNADQHSLADFSGSLTIDSDAGTFTYSLDGRVGDTSNHVRVTAATLTAFHGVLADDHPTSGVMQITGDRTSRALLEGLSSTQARISVDADGDAAYESSSNTTWDALEGLPD